MFLRTEEEISRVTLWYSCTQTELFSDMTKNSQETIHKRANFLKLRLVCSIFLKLKIFQIFIGTIGNTYS